MAGINRRYLIIAGGLAAAAATGATPTPSGYAHADRSAADVREAERGIRRAIRPGGTTLIQTAQPTANRADGKSGYRRLTAGPGYPLVVRSDLAKGRPDRDDRRTPQATVVQLTDLHMLDAQSPMRFEFLHDITGSAFRPQEALGTQGAAQLIKQVNEIGYGPFSGRRFDCVVSTGDNTDNHETIELDWFLTTLSGGSITPNTGDPDRWEGVQSGGDKNYYNPELSVQDRYKQAGFPPIDGFFDRATTKHRSPGLQTPWYSVFGNHDNAIQGTLPSGFGLLDAIYTGGFKFTGFGDPVSDAALAKAVRDSETAILRMPQQQITAGYTSNWRVTPDQRREPFSPQEYMRRHRRSAVTGPGPVGHGFSAEAVDSGRGYYTFGIAEGVTGIALDSTNRAGFTAGSLGEEHWNWLIETLQASSSAYWRNGDRQTQDVTDEYFVLFSHHTSKSMNNLMIDPKKPEGRRSGAELVTLLQDFPNVLAWVNGHSHVNEITPHGHADPRRSFWEINTASHIDFPQHGRIIDICDNRDGTLSLFTTLIESAAPYQASYSSGTQAALASVYRELSFNDIHAKASAQGKARDRNTELLLINPQS